MSFVEFLGPSGIGKSNLREQILKVSKCEKLISFENAYLLANWHFLSSRVFEHFNLDNYLSVIRHWSVRNKSSDFFTNETLNDDSFFASYSQLLNEALHNTFASSRPLHLKLQISRFLENLMFQHYTINVNCNFDKLVLMDEGLLMNLRGIEDSNFDSNKHLKQVLPKIVVNCMASKDLGCYRYIKRSLESGKIITAEEAAFAYEVTRKRANKVLRKLQQYNVVVLDFDLDDLSDSKVNVLKNNLLETVNTNPH